MIDDSSPRLNIFLKLEFTVREKFIQRQLFALLK